MARNLNSIPNIQSPDSDYPNGRILDHTPTVVGTPMNESVFGDLIQFAQKLMRAASITPNGLPDNEYSGLQIFEALVNRIQNLPHEYSVVDISSLISFNTGWQSAGNNRAVVNSNGDVEWNMNIDIVPGGTTSVGTLPVAYRPTVQKRFPVADYNGTDGGTLLLILYIDPSGAMTLLTTAGAKPADRGFYQTIRYNINY